MPYVSVSSATKSFNMAPSVALTRELSAEHPDMEVLGIVVGAVQTARTGRAGMQKAWAVPSQEGMARAALGRVGCGRAVEEGYWGHAVQMAFLRWALEWVVRKVLVDAVEPMRGKAGGFGWGGEGGACYRKKE